MKNPITFLEISNYKSIEHIHLDCKRINIFIGKPNVGKSNILEAISLLAPEYLSETMSSKKFGAAQLRYEVFNNLFPFNDTKKPIYVGCDFRECMISYHYQSRVFLFQGTKPKDDLRSIVDKEKKYSLIDEIIENFKGETSPKSLEIPTLKDNQLKSDWLQNSFIYTIYKEGLVGGFNMIRAGSNDYPIKKYEFRKYDRNNHSISQFHRYLLPPFGENLLAILENIASLMERFQKEFYKYDLEILIDKTSNENEYLEIQRKEGFYSYKVPLYLTADTLQRMMFFYSAIESNRDSVLLFEEPEAHSFPPYIKDLAEKIVDDQNNQYFINTHSPFVLNTIVEQTDLSELAVFKVDYHDHKTVVEPVSDDDLLGLLNFGQDILMNL